MVKNKKMLALAFIGVLAVAGITGGTLAYFTDSKVAENTITMGDVDINLEEPEYDKNHPNKEITDVTPNQVIEKDPTITIKEGSKAAYIRCKINVTSDDETALPAGYAEALIANTNMDMTLWKKGADGYYYYKNKVEPVAPNNTVKFFNEVKIPETWGKEMANRSISMDVTAEAIQADNFTPAMDEDGFITGWFMSDGTTPVTPDNYNN